LYTILFPFYRIYFLVVTAIVCRLGGLSPLFSPLLK